MADFKYYLAGEGLAGDFYWDGPYYEIGLAEKTINYAVEKQGLQTAAILTAPVSGGVSLGLAALQTAQRVIAEEDLGPIADTVIGAIVARGLVNLPEVGVLNSAVFGAAASDMTKLIRELLGEGSNSSLTVVQELNHNSVHVVVGGEISSNEIQKLESFASENDANRSITFVSNKEIDASSKNPLSPVSETDESDALHNYQDESNAVSINFPAGADQNVEPPATYIVEPRDSLWSVANETGIAFKDLLEANRQFTDPNVIQPGDVINLSLDTDDERYIDADIWDATEGPPGTYGGYDLFGAVDAGGLPNALETHGDSAESSPGFAEAEAPSDARSDDGDDTFTALNGSLTSAYKLYSAIEGDNPFGIAGSSLSLVASADDFEVIDFSDAAMDGISNVNAGVAVAGSAWSFYEAIDRGDALGAAGSGLALARQGTSLYASAATSTQAAAATAQAVSAGFGVAAGALGTVTSAMAGDFIGVVASVMMTIPIPMVQAIGFVIAVANALGVFGDDPEPYEAPTGEGHFTRTGDDGIGISAEGIAGNQGDNVRESLAGRMGELQRHLSETPSGDELVRVALQQTLRELRADLPEDAAIIPERLPSLSFNGYYYIAEFGDPDTGHTREIAIAPADVVDTLADLAYYTEAVAPQWEAAGVALLYQAGDPQYWYTEEQHAYVEFGEASAAAFMPIGLDLSGDGVLATNGLAYFDVDDDDYRELTQWIMPEDGLLVLDRDFDGQVDRASELFSNPALAAVYRGLGGLAWLDVNDDGIIDENDPVFDALRVWRDGNTDGVSDPGELETLDDVGITGLHYAHADTPDSTPTAHGTDGIQIGMASVALAAEARGVRIEHRDGGVVIEEEGGETTFRVQDAVDLGLSEKSPRDAPANAKAVLIDRDGVQRELRAASEAAARATPFGEPGVGLLAFGMGFGNAEANTFGSDELAPIEPSAHSAPASGDGGIPGMLGDPLSSSHGTSPASNVRSVSHASLAPALPGKGDDSDTPRQSENETAHGAPESIPRASFEPSSRLPSETNFAPADVSVPTSNDRLETPQTAITEPLDGTRIGGPIAGDDRITIPEDSIALITPAALLANDAAFANTDSIVVSDVRNPEHGTVSLGTDGLIRFTPERDFFGEAHFEYVISDNRGRSDVAIATVVVSPVNDIPVASNEAVNAIEDIAAVFAGMPASHPLLQNDYDIEGDLLSISSVSSATHGVVSLAADNTVTFVPNSNYFGTAQFDYTVDDGHGGTATATAFIDVLPVNDAPRFSGVDYMTGRASGQVLANDLDNAPDELRYAIEQHPLNGAATIDVMTGMWSYSSTPCNPYFGDDPFVVSVTDPGGETDTITVETRHAGSTCNNGKKPLVIDLDGDGLEITGVDDSTVFFDVNDDGWREKIAWPGHDDGLITFDKNDDGIISDYDEISFVGYADDARSDLEGLRAFDTNEDDVLSALDDQWGRFGVWQDANQDGITDPGELTSLDERGISGIDLIGQRQHEHFDDGSVLFGTTAFTSGNGQTGTVGDVRLAYDPDDVLPMDTSLSELVDSPRSAAEAMDRVEGAEAPYECLHAIELEREVTQLRADMAGFESVLVGPEAVHFDSFEPLMLAESVDDVNDTAPY